MRPILSLCVLSLLSSAAAIAADPVPAKLAVDSWRDMAVSPRGIERPLTKYRLLPAEYELREGNAAPILLRLPWEQTLYFSQEVPNLAHYSEIPLNDPVFKGNDIFPFFRRIKGAAYRKTADWQYPIGEEPFGEILLPDVQGARSVVGHGLSAWIRQRLAQGKLDQAREGILVGLAVVRHYGRTPFTINQLVCCAVDSMFMARIAELIAQPDSPNLYWALTELPRPLVDVRPSIQMEQRFLQMTVPGLDDLGQIRTKEEWTGRALAVIKFFRDSDQNVRPEAGGNAAAFERVVKAARDDLPASTPGGFKRVEEMSDGEAALRWMLHGYDDLMSEMAALQSLDPPTALPRLRALNTRIKDYQTIMGAPRAAVVVASANIYASPRKLEREIDALRIVEAIRNYAAGHDARLPASLGQITDLPIPNDPFTGKPFHYEVKDGVATLSGDTIPLPDPERPPAAIRYTIRIRK